MGGEENTPNPMNPACALGELLPLQGKTLCSMGTFIKKLWFTFSSQIKNQILLKIKLLLKFTVINYYV